MNVLLWHLLSLPAPINRKTLASAALLGILLSRSRGYRVFGCCWSQQLGQSDALHAVLFFLLTGLMPNSLPLVASPLLTGCLVLAQIMREGNGIPQAFTK